MTSKRKEVPKRATVSTIASICISSRLLLQVGSIISRAAGKNIDLSQ